jgi:hypothetical protein
LSLAVFTEAHGVQCIRALATADAACV